MFKKIQEWWNGLWSDESPYEPVDPKEIMATPSFDPRSIVTTTETPIPDVTHGKSKPAKKKRAVKKSPAKKRGKK